MRRFIKKPTPHVLEAIAALIEAVDAHIAGDVASAARLFEKSNCPFAWKWLDDAWNVPIRNVIDIKPPGDSTAIPKSDRDPDRTIRSSVKNAVLKRDGYRCRYCGLPVVSAEIRKIAHLLYPREVPWSVTRPENQHAAFQITWLQYDHVEPHSHGGLSSLDNVVVSCALCNFGKFNFTLKQLGIEDPRQYPPTPSDFDGLERLRVFAPAPKRRQRTRAPNDAISGIATPDPRDTDELVIGIYFFPGAHISAGYVNIPPVCGKSRWFKIGPSIAAAEVELNGDRGCIVCCPRKSVARRGIDEAMYQVK